MIRIIEQEWNKAIKNMRKSGMNIKAFGGGVTGFYSIYYEDKKIMHHQFEYEEYFEIEEEYAQYTKDQEIEWVLLKCINSDEEGRVHLTVNKVYVAFKELNDGDLLYIITDDDGWDCGYTIEPDREGKSYKNWFEIVEDK